MKSKHIPWVIALLFAITFLVIDAGALAWAASLVNGRQLAVEMFTFFVVLSGGAITFWRMRA
jgi:hypothetical protein